MLAAAVLALVVVLVAVPFWPGRMDADTLNEIGDAMSGVYSDEHAPILEAIWHPFITHGIGPGWILVGQLVLVVASLYVLLRLVTRPVPAALIVLVICLSPPVYGQLGKVGRDAWFLALLLASFACASRYVCGSPRFRWLWLAGTIAFAWFYADVAPECRFRDRDRARAGGGADPAETVSAPRCAAVVVSARGARRRWRRHARDRGTQKLVDKAIGVVPVYRTADLFVYDLARLSRAEHRNLFPASVVPNRALGPIETHSSEVSMVPMIVGPGHPVPFPYTKKEYGELRHAWITAIEGNPGDYLDDRFTNFLAESSISQQSVYAYHLVIDPNPWGYHTTFPWADRIANDYEQPFINLVTTNGRFLYTVWAYLLACVLAVIAAARRLTRRTAVFGALALSALTYQISLALLLMGNDYRFEFPSVVIGELVTAAGLCVAVQRLRRRHSSTAAGPAAATPATYGSRHRPAALEERLARERLLAEPIAVVDDRLAGHHGTRVPAGCATSRAAS